MPKKVYQYSQELKGKSRRLRHQATATENFLWKYLRNRRMERCKFYRQYPLGSYILDFYCPEKRLAIEVDGGQHIEGLQARQDKFKEKYLLAHKIKTLRFWDNEVFQNNGGVLEVIYNSLRENPMTSP